MFEAEMKQKLGTVLAQVLRLLEPEDYEKAKDKVYIAGGAIVSLTLGEAPADYDLFVEDDATANIFRSCVGTSIPLAAGADLLANTENGLTWKLKTGEVIQVVTRFTGPVTRIFDDFDFEHTKCYYKPGYYSDKLQLQEPDQLVYNPELILGKRLRYDGKKDKFALNTLKRFGKFVHRGWVADNETVMNLYKVIQHSPPIEDPAEHAKQVCGFYGSSHT